jgi:branched-chain amino acid transport system ATP-binding protein
VIVTAQPTDALLRVENLEVVYHNVSTALQGLSFSVTSDQIVALLGTNGAGKSTTLRAISGFLGLDYARVTKGFIAFRGEEIQGKLPHQVTKKGIVLVPEREKIFENLTVEENLQISVPAAGRRNSEEAYEMVFRYFDPLNKVRGRLAGYLSGGERQMLALGTALLCKPRLLLVDELSLGLAPVIVAELMGLVRRIRDQEGVAVLLVEQNAAAALEIADYAYILESGRIVLAGEPATLKDDPNIKEFYLGQGQDSRKKYSDVKQYRRTRRWYG